MNAAPDTSKQVLALECMLAELIGKIAPGLGADSANLLSDARIASVALDEMHLTPAVRQILAERHRQIHTKGNTLAGDAERNQRGELCAAAAAYAAAAGPVSAVAYSLWPWDFISWKPGTNERNLEKAGGLVIAALESIHHNTIPSCHAA